MFKPIQLTFMLAVVFTFFSCKTNQKSKDQDSNKTSITEKQEPKLEWLWETDSSLITCESVLYHAESGKIFVANVNNSPWEHDHNGFISIIDSKGNIIEQTWVDGMSSPKGMGIVGNKLYVNDIDRIVEIDIPEKKIINTFPIEGSPDLNDISVSDQGIVYASGSASGFIYSLHNNNIDTIYSSEFERLNGLLCIENDIYFASSKNNLFGKFDKDTQQTKVLTTGIGHGDGIVKLPNNDFIVSNWRGEIYYIYSKNWNAIKLLDTKEDKINAADIDFIPEENILLVPTFFNNRVVAYKLIY